MNIFLKFLHISVILLCQRDISSGFFFLHRVDTRRMILRYSNIYNNNITRLKHFACGESVDIFYCSTLRVRKFCRCAVICTLPRLQFNITPCPTWIWRVRTNSILNMLNQCCSDAMQCVRCNETQALLFFARIT